MKHLFTRQQQKSPVWFAVRPPVEEAEAPVKRRLARLKSEKNEASATNWALWYTTTPWTKR